MPSTMRSLFKRRNKTDSPTSVTKHVGGDRSTPPMITPIDPDGSTASHSSNENYLSNPSSPNDHDAPPGANMTASQFKTYSDEEMATKQQQQQQNGNNKISSSPSKRGKNCQTKSREGVPIITSSGADHFSPSAVSSKTNYATDGFYSKSKKAFGGKERPKVRPSAKNSAFGGAPRYDWMDIETTAAIKLQAAYRRVQTLNQLDAAGISTPGMRNRRAQRQARYQSRMSRNVTSADVPFPFNMCGVGLLFGDGTFEDETIVDGLEKKRLEKVKAQIEREDEEKRKFHMRKKESQHLEEGIEVVESFEEGEEKEAQEVQEKTPRSRSLKNLGKSKKSLRSPNRSKSKKLGRKQNDFDPNEEEGEFF